MSDWQNPAFLNQYAALTTAVGLADVGRRTQVELTGRDRATFLNNFCTNDVRRLEPGAGCEAFITSVQGKVLAHVFVFCRAESLVIDTVPAQAQRIIEHLDRYLIREDVQFHNRSDEWNELLLAGPAADLLLTNHGIGVELPAVRLSHVDATLFDVTVSLRRVDITRGGGFFISSNGDSAEKTADGLRGAGAIPCAGPAVEAARIEAGFPYFGLDITDKNLPQEVGRDTLAISFTKGCYLGQETVARIDALGHVNRTLVGLRFSGDEVPPPSTELFAADQSVAAVTSAAYSPLLKGPLALGYARRGHHEPGTRLSSPLGEAQVIALPVA